MSPRKPKPSSKPAPPVSYAPTTNFAWEVPWNQSPIVLTTVFGFLWLAGTLAFASRYAATAFVLWHLLIDGGMACLWLGSATGYGLQLLRLAKLSEQHIDPPLRLVTAAALGLGAMGLTVLGLGLLGILARWSAMALVAGGVLILVLMLIGAGADGTEAAAPVDDALGVGVAAGRAGGDHRHDGGAHAARRDVGKPGAQRL